MSRPRKCCRVSFLPGVTYFKPAGMPLRLLSEVCLSFEELEAVRLRDIEDLDQEQCAGRMNISRPTFQRVLKSARRKIADGLIGGKAIRVDGGKFVLRGQIMNDVLNELGHGSGPDNNMNILGRDNEMKIAVVTDDEKIISQHFGRASLYVVYTVEDGKVTGKETRPKMGHRHFASAEGPHAEHGAKHGFDADSRQNTPVWLRQLKTARC